MERYTFAVLMACSNILHTSFGRDLRYFLAAPALLCLEIVPTDQTTATHETQEHAKLY